MKTLAIIQARMGSTRLPGKVLLPLGDKPSIAHVIERVSRIETITQVIVATPNSASNDPLANLFVLLNVYQ